MVRGAGFRIVWYEGRTPDTRPDYGRVSGTRIARRLLRSLLTLRLSPRAVRPACPAQALKVKTPTSVSALGPLRDRGRNVDAAHLAAVQSEARGEPAEPSGEPYVLMRVF